MPQDTPPTTLILLPGLDGSGILFEPLLAALDDTFKPKIIRYASDCTWGYDEWIDSVSQQIDKLIDADERYILLGESFSGPIAIELASRSPAGLCGLVLCATFAHSPHPLLTLSKPAISWFPLPANMAKNPAGTFALLGHKTTPELLQLAQRALSPLPSATVRARLKAVSTVDKRHALSVVSVPMLYLQAQRDRLVLSASTRAMQKLRPDMQCELFDTAHGLLQVAPFKAAQSLKRFSKLLA